jgi:hypothetical protein
LHLAFFSSLLKDIKAERPKITESDNIRLLVVVKWYLEFFLNLRTKEMADKSDGVIIDYADMQWKFEMVGEVVEKSWIGWVLKRMRMAMDDKVCLHAPSKSSCHSSDCVNICSQSNGRNYGQEWTASPKSCATM